MYNRKLSVQIKDMSLLTLPKVKYLQKLQESPSKVQKYKLDTANGTLNFRSVQKRSSMLPNIKPRRHSKILETSPKKYTNI